MTPLPVLDLRDGRRLALRPIGPDDLDDILELGRRTSPDDLRLRFFSYVRPAPGPLVARLVNPDPTRLFALAAYDPAVPGGEHEILGVIRLHDLEAPGTAEFAILVRTDLKRHGLGRALMRAMLQLARSRGLACVRGEVLSENAPMLRLARALGARAEPSDQGVTRVVFDLTSPASAR